LFFGFLNITKAFTCEKYKPWVAWSKRRGCRLNDWMSFFDVRDTLQSFF
jgi:hypothetical protein